MLDKFKQFTDLVALGILAVRLDGEGAGNRRLNILAVAASCADIFETESYEQRFEVAEAGRAVR